MKKMIAPLIILASLLLLTACSGGGGGGPNIPADNVVDTNVAPANVAGTWDILEEIDDSGCGGTGATTQYRVSVTQTGSSLTVVTPVGTFSGAVSGSTLSWTGEYFDSGDNGWEKITAMSLAISANNLSGTANWEFRNTENGPLTCTGTTKVTAIRTGEQILPPDAPSGLTTTTTSATTIRLDWSDNSNNEQFFKIERSPGSANNFSEVSSVGTNIKTFTDTGLTSATTYHYRIRAQNSGGSSGYSNIAQATTTTASQTPPTAPGNLKATMPATNSVQLTWDDVANNESSYRIERRLSNTSYSQIIELPANATSYTDNNGVQGSTTYYYRVTAYNSAGASSAEISQATPLANTAYNLTVRKSGSGSGAVTGVGVGVGIDCGSDCTESISAGTPLTLTATPTSDSIFAGWTDCDSSNDTSCTLTMSSSRAVAAIFNTKVSTQITLNLPESSSTGGYTLSWLFSGGTAPSSWSIQEASDDRFSTPASYTSNQNKYDFINKANGTYCYRVRTDAASLWSAPACITAADANASVLRVTNNTKYDLIDLQLDGEQKITPAYPILPGKSKDFVFAADATVKASYSVGFFKTDAILDPWFTGEKDITLPAGQRQALTINNPTLGNMLTAYLTLRNWSGKYYCNSCSTLVHSARFLFYNNGKWDFYDDGVPKATGTVTPVSWPTYGSVITFKICPASECADIQLRYPFNTFTYGNGPKDSPNIEYIAQ